MGQSKLIMSLKRGGTQAPIYAIPATGATPLSFVHLTRSMKTGYPFFGFTFAGLNRDEPYHTSVEEMATAYIQEIALMLPSQAPIVLGHCGGGFTAFEIVRQLEAAQQPVCFLILIESFCPLKGLDKDHRPLSLSREMATMVDQETNKLVTKVKDNINDNQSHLPEKQAAHLEEVTQAHLKASLDYVTGPIQTPIALLRTNTFQDAPYCHWQNLTSGGFTDRRVPGNDHTVLQPPHCTMTADAVSQALRRAVS